jgi:energy-coupling factor transporter ATP-binding protein EcfA2
MSGHDALKVEDLKVYYWTDRGPIKAVDGINLEVKKRERFGIVGESGCGKSTTAMSLLRLIKPPGATNAVSGAILAEVFLEILGLGPQNTTTLGVMVYWAMWRGAMIRGILWWVLPPMIILVLIFVGLQLINIGLDEVYNPRVRKGGTPS